MNIKFTSGTIERLTEYHLTLTLYNKDEVVYTSTIDDVFSESIIKKWPNKINLLNEKKINNQL